MYIILMVEDNLKIEDEILKIKESIENIRNLVKSKTEAYSIKKKIEGVLFFSPSAVKSYAKNNSFDSKICFSWGNTTAKEIAKYSDNYFVSKKPEINSLILLIKNTLK